MNKKNEKVSNKVEEKKVDLKKSSSFKKKEKNKKERYIWSCLCLLYI